MFPFTDSLDVGSQHNLSLHLYVEDLILKFVGQTIGMTSDMNWHKTLNMSSILMTTRGQMLVLLVMLALTNCVVSSQRCVALCHRSEADSLCKRCRFREPMRFGKRSNKQTFREPLRFGKRLEDYTDYVLDKRSVSLTPGLIRLLMARYSE